MTVHNLIRPEDLIRPHLKDTTFSSFFFFRFFVKTHTLCKNYQSHPVCRPKKSSSCKNPMDSLKMTSCWLISDRTSSYPLLTSLASVVEETSHWTGRYVPAFWLWRSVVTSASELSVASEDCWSIYVIGFRLLTRVFLQYFPDILMKSDEDVKQTASTSVILSFNRI